MAKKLKSNILPAHTDDSWERARKKGTPRSGWTYRAARRNALKRDQHVRFPKANYAPKSGVVSFKRKGRPWQLVSKWC